MLRAIHTPSEIEKSQKRFRECVREAFRTRIPNVTVGYQGGNISLEVVGNNTVWFAYQSLTEVGVPRHWNALGAGQPALGRSNAITVEVNVASPWAGKQVAGLFAQDDAGGDIVILHRGTVGGSSKGVGKAAFTRWYEENGGEVVPFLSPAGERELAFRVADLQRGKFIGGIESFVEAVQRFKSSIKGDDSGLLSDADLEILAAGAPARPRSSTTATVVYRRDPAVAELAKRRAGGKCDLCRKPAPFMNASDKPYLESHHIEWLAHGGSDRLENTVALCPNCHRKMHVVGDPEDVQRLKRRTRSRKAR